MPLIPHPSLSLTLRISFPVVCTTVKARLRVQQSTTTRLGANTRIARREITQKRSWPRQLRFR